MAGRIARFKFELERTRPSAVLERALCEASMQRQHSATIKTPLLVRMGNWLRAVVGKEQHADPDWEEDVKRAQSGKMGEDIRLPEDMRTSRR